MCAIGAKAWEAYACYDKYKTLTFYYDNQRSTRSGTTYDLNTGNNRPGWYLDGISTSVTRVVFNFTFGNFLPTTTYSWFFMMENLESITDMSYLNTSEVTSMAHMFTDCKKLTSIDVSYFNTSKVTNMRSMFNGCTGLTSLDLERFNTSQVTDMSMMFSESVNLQTIYVGNGWTTASVTSSNDMFKNCSSLVGDKGTSYLSSNPKDKTYAHLDGGSSNPGYFSEYKRGYACYTSSNKTLTFYNDDQRDSRLGTIYKLNEGNIVPEWYDEDPYVEKPTKVVFDPSFASARPTSTFSWFLDMGDLKSITGIQYLNTSEVTNMSYMFSGCGLTSIDVSHFDTSSVTDMSCMFRLCETLMSLDVSNWNTASVTNMAFMFGGCSNLMSLDVSNWNTSSVTYMHDMFYWCLSLQSLDVSNWDTSSVTDITNMFNNCQNLEDLDVSHFDTSSVTDMSSMFRSCQTLTSLDVSKWNTASVKKMSYMFDNCTNLTSLDLSNWNTATVTHMYNMFSSCKNLQTVYVGDGWSTAAVTSSTSSNNMFNNCTSLVGGKGTTYNASYVDKTYAHIDGEGGPGYFSVRSTGIATDIETVTHKAASVQGIYTLDGRKLDEQPNKKGVYIVDGRKVVVR